MELSARELQMLGEGVATAVNILKEQGVEEISQNLIVDDRLVVVTFRYGTEDEKKASQERIAAAKKEFFRAREQEEMSMHRTIHPNCEVCEFERKLKNDSSSLNDD